IVVAGVTPVPGWPASLAAEPVSNSPRAAASSKALVTSSRWSYHHCASSASLAGSLSLSAMASCPFLHSAHLGSSTCAKLGSAANGAILYCSNCMQTTSCAAGGSGAMAMYVNGAWSCAGGGGGGSYTFRNNLTNTSGTVDFTPLDSSVMNAVDDFLPSTDTSGSIGQLGWGPTSIGSGCSAVSNNGVTNHPGIFNLRAGNAANSGCTLTLSD